MILLKKTIRAMIRHKRAYISCIILMALGVWTYTVMNTALSEIVIGRDDYYETRHLADIWVSVSQIPKTAVSGLEEIEGIKTANGRIVSDIRVILPEMEEEIIRLRAISTELGRNDERINSYVVTGNDLAGSSDIVVGEDFYLAYGYEPGDSIELLVDRRRYDFTVMGRVLSPEYVYIVENEGELFSDTTRFNIAFMDETAMMSMLGMEGAYNDLLFLLEDGYTYDDVKGELESELKKYGLIGMYEKDDHFSYNMLEEEISGGQSMSTTIPITFVMMAAVVLYLMLRRIIEQERTQIGTLKAFGYSDRRVLFHYINHGLLTGIAGAVLGLGLSFISIAPYMQIYLDYYKMPLATEVTDYRYFIIGGFWAIGGGMIGAYFGARKLVKLKPAEAMRPKAPPPIKKDSKWMMALLKPVLTSRGFMTVRNISRSKVRSGFVIVSIVFSYSMIVLIGMMTGLMDNMFFNQFNHVLKYDAEMVLWEDIPYNQGVQEAMALDEITYAEGILTVPVMLSNGHEMSGTNLIGIKEDTRLYKVYDDNDLINIQLDKDGIILGSILASNLEVEKGDYVYLSGPDFAKDVKLYVQEVANQNLGATGYIDLELLSELMDQDLKINSVLINTSDTNEVRDYFNESEVVKKVEDKAKTQELYESLLGSFGFIIFIMQILAIAIGFTIIYNTAVISLSERTREYATLRVLGMTINEVKEIMSLEYWLLCLAGILLGIPFSYYLNSALIDMIDIEAFTWPASIPVSAFIMGAIGCGVAVAFSNMTSIRTIKKLDLVEVLKERE